MRKLAALEAKLSELNGTIAYNQKCLQDEDPESEAAIRISEILQRKQKEQELCLDKVQKIRAELHIETEIDNSEPVQMIYEFFDERANEIWKKIRDTMEEFKR